jgi:hypothetical protein
MKDMISLKEHQRIVNGYESSMNALQMQWSQDIKRMMRLWDSHQRLIAFLESFDRAGFVGVSSGVKELARKEVEGAKKVKI